MKNSALVSVIIPTFNRALTLERSLKSVLEQDYKNFELIVIDDGSSDNTKELVESIKIQYESHDIIYHYQDNAGVSCARNTGAQLAKGCYLSFLDSDDEWLTHKLDEQVHFMQAYPQFQWVHGDEIWIRNGVRVNQMNKHKKGGGDQFLRSLKLCLISPSTVLMKKSLYIEHNGFREDFVVCEDYDLWLRLLICHPIGFIGKPLIRKYGGHEDQLSAKFFAMDYWRIKTLGWLLVNEELGQVRKNELIKVGLKKAKLLCKGYIKHNNLENLKEIESIQSLFQEHLLSLA